MGATTHNVLGTRNLKGILGETFKICGRNFLRLLVIVAAVQVPLWTAVFGIRSQVPSVIGAIGARVLFTVAQAFFWGAVIHAVSEQYLQRTVHIGRAYRFAWARLWALSVVLILIFLLGCLVDILSAINPFLVAIGLLPFTYFVVRWAFALQAASLERLGPIDALSRSSELVQGSWWRIFGILLALTLIFFIIFLAGTYLTAGPLLNTIIVVILATPIFAIGQTLLYYDVRLRKEGYSLESLAKELRIKTDSDIAQDGAKVPQ
jgi:hypothetical protein